MKTNIPRYLIVFILAAAIFVTTCEKHGDMPKSFNSQKWKEAETLPDPRTGPRLKMADDLVSSRCLIGMPEKQVRKLLGSSTKTGKWKEWDFVYWLGPERSYFSIDSEWLVIRIDKNKKVQEVRMVRD